MSHYFSAIVTYFFWPPTSAASSFDKSTTSDWTISRLSRELGGEWTKRALNDQNRNRNSILRTGEGNIILYVFIFVQTCPGFGQVLSILKKSIAWSRAWFRFPKHFCFRAQTVWQPHARQGIHPCMRRHLFGTKLNYTIYYLGALSRLDYLSRKSCHSISFRLL